MKQGKRQYKVERFNIKSNKLMYAQNSLCGSKMFEMLNDRPFIHHVLLVGSGDLLLCYD